MGFISYILIVFICIGFALIVFSFVKKEEKNKFDFSEIESFTELVNKSIEEVDDAIEQLNKLSDNVFKEFEEKYQELLFLYQLIDEKKIKIDRKIDNQSNPKNLKNVNFIYKNPHLEEIKKLQMQGMTVSDISKKLNMGKGEVKFIMELGKPR